MKNGLRGPILLLLIAALVVIMPPVCTFSATSELMLSVTAPNGSLTLGMTKQQVLKVMGKPSSPQNYDFVYPIEKGEVIITFDDQTKLLDAVIVRGDTNKYSISGITIGDTKEKLMKKFGDPEIMQKIDKGKTECWYYPSRNLYFCLGTKNIVTSFSLSNCCETIKKK